MPDYKPGFVFSSNLNSLASHLLGPENAEQCFSFVRTMVNHNLLLADFRASPEKRLPRSHTQLLLRRVIMTISRFQQHSPHIADTAFVAPNATLIGDVHMADHASLWFSAVIRGDTAPIRIGEGSNIQDLCVLHADPGFPLTMGRNITVGHRAILHGCTLEDDCLIGMGAIVMNGAKIGRGSIVAAGAVVLENALIPPFSLVAGMPAKPVKTFGEEIIVKIRESAEHYREKATLYRTGDFQPLA